MRLDTLKYYIQSANINFLYGSGLSKPYLPTLGNIEIWLTELNEEKRKNGEKVEYSIVEASILKNYFMSVMEPNIAPSGVDYEQTISEYRHFLSIWNDLINKRNSRLIRKQVNLFTTNIDMMMERAASGYGVELNDGFQGSIEQVFDAGNFQKTVSKTSLHFQNVADIPSFNLMKIHGSINWHDETGIVKNDIGLPTVSAVKIALASIDANNFIPLTKTDSSGKTVYKTITEMISEAHSKGLTDDNVFNPFFEQYRKLVMINPTKRKFRESVIDHHFYELMRQYSNNLEKENSLLFVSGFSFADEHLADITRRAANTNPTLHVVVFAFDDHESDVIRNNLNVPATSPNNNIVILSPIAIKKANEDGPYKDLVSSVSMFDFSTVNKLFEAISNSIVIHGK